MTILKKETVLTLHRWLTDATGGDPTLRDEGLLDSALSSAFATFDGVDLYPTAEEKAAKLGYSLVKNHAFVDGNKRIGVLVMLTFLSLNGLPFSAEDQEISALGWAVGDGSMDYDALLQWIKIHTKS